MFSVNEYNHLIQYNQQLKEIERYHQSRLGMEEMPLEPWRLAVSLPSLKTLVRRLQRRFSGGDVAPVRQDTPMPQGLIVSCDMPLSKSS